MNNFSLPLYELSKRFQLYTAWKLAIISFSIGFAWITWQVAVVTSAVYLTVASLFAPEGSDNASNTKPSIFSSAKYAWNAANYHQGAGATVGKREIPQGTATLYKQNSNSCAQAPCFRLAIFNKEADSYPLPSKQEITKLFGNVLNGSQPHEIYMHSPYRRARDLIITHYDTSLFLGSIGVKTGFGMYSSDYSDKIKKDVRRFLPLYGSQSQTLYCGFKNEGNGKWQYKAVYWYKKRPPGTEHEYLRRTFGKNHPLLQIFDPVTVCPNRYVEK